MAHRLQFCVDKFHHKNLCVLDKELERNETYLEAVFNWLHYWNQSEMY